MKIIIRTTDMLIYSIVRRRAISYGDCVRIPHSIDRFTRIFWGIYRESFDSLLRITKK